MTDRLEIPWQPHLARPVGLPSCPPDLFMPYVPIEVRGPRDSVRLLAQLDTGADFTYLPATYLERLGLAEPRGTGEADFPLAQARAAPVEYHQVDLSIGLKWVTTLTVAFAHWEGTGMDPLIGRQVMRNLRVTLDGPNRVTIIEAPQLSERAAAVREAA